LPEGLQISTLLIEEEKPQLITKNIRVKLPSREISGPAFQEKSEKNKKVNHKVRYSELMKIKYKHPKTRGQKPKGGK
jgi:ATP-dependent RNA helicase RhlE